MLVVLMQYFGWRASTVVGLKTIDVVVGAMDIRVYSSSFKTKVVGGLPMGVLKLTHLPCLFAAVTRYVQGVRSDRLFGSCTGSASVIA